MHDISVPSIKGAVSVSKGDRPSGQEGAVQGLAVITIITCN